MAEFSSGFDDWDDFFHENSKNGAPSALVNCSRAHLEIRRGAALLRDLP
jgi:hypothetical protein